MAIAGLFSPGHLLAQPPNDNCWQAEVMLLEADSSIVRTGNNEDATAGQLSTPQVWEAFTITECLDVTVSYCGTTPVFGGALIDLYVGCDEVAGFGNGVRHPEENINTTDCSDGNFTIPYEQLAPGTYYIAVIAGPGTVGDYVLTITGTPCAATPPANDDCAGAITLVPNNTCLPTPGDVYGAPAGVSLPATQCAGYTGDASDDVWYQFTATAESHTIIVTPSAMFDATIDLRSGSCGSTVSIDCGEVGGSGGVETLNATDLTIGETYFIRVNDWWSGLPPTTTFDICVIGPGGGGCEAAAGSLTGEGEVCQDDVETLLAALPAGNANVPAGFTTTYMVAMGPDDVILGLGEEPEFFVAGLGNYSIHTLVYDETTFDISSIVTGVTTLNDIHVQLEQGGGTICASLDLTGAAFSVVECSDCTASAGTLSGGGEVCLVDGEASLTATLNGDTVLPAGYSIIHLLSGDPGMTLIATSAAPEFTVTATGNYSIHTLVYHADSLDIGSFVPDSTTMADIDALLEQGGGDICGSLDLSGATFTVIECGTCDAQAGTLTPLIGEVCLVDGSATLEAIANEDTLVPPGFQQVFLLSQGVNMTIIDVSTDPTFDVGSIGNFTMHSLVFDPMTLNLDVIDLGSTTVMEFDTLLIQGGGIICASLDLGSAGYAVSDCTPLNDLCDDAFGLNVHAIGDCAGNAIPGTNIFASGGTLEPACDPSTDGYADVWYAFNAGENDQVFVDVAPVSITGWGVAVYMDCDGTELIACEAEPASPLVVNTTPGANYLVMVYTNLQAGQTGDFTICLTGEETVNICLGGDVMTNNGESTVMICASQLSDPIVFLSAGVAAQNYTFILTDENDTIIDVLSGNTMDFSDAPVGIYHVYGVSHNGDLIGATAGEPIDSLDTTGECIAISESFVTVNVEICTAVEATTSIDWNIFPNPADGLFNIVYNGEAGEVQLLISDMAGRIVSDQQLVLNTGERHVIDLRGTILPGMYNIVLMTTEGRSSARVIVQ